jgi:hypothetical protein
VLLNFYAAAGRLPSLRHLFNEMPFRDISSHNTMMTPYAAVEAGRGGGIDAARHLFDGMLLGNVNCFGRTMRLTNVSGFALGLYCV